MILVQCPCLVDGIMRYFFYHSVGYPGSNEASSIERIQVLREHIIPWYGYYSNLRIFVLCPSWILEVNDSPLGLRILLLHSISFTYYRGKLYLILSYVNSSYACVGSPLLYLLVFIKH